MKAAVVQEPGKTPVYGDFKEPIVGDGQVRIHVAAASLSNLTRGRAAGTHYSFSTPPPFIPGVDGVGRLDDGQRVYFVMPSPPLGSMAERTVVGSLQCIGLPDDLDDLTAAAIANPGMSVWAAMKERAHFNPGETVLINGATGTAGRLAVQVAKFMGAGKVIATGRNVVSLEALSNLGADVLIPLVQSSDDLDRAFQSQFADGVDVVLDYLWGPSAEKLIFAAAKHGQEDRTVRFVQIGAMTGGSISVPASALRSAPIELMGSGIGSVPVAGLLKSIGELLHATTPGGFSVETEAIPLSAVEENWVREASTPRIVFTIE